MFRVMGRLTDFIDFIPGADEYIHDNEALPTELLEKVYVQHLHFHSGPQFSLLDLALAFEGELTLALPGVDFLQFGIGANIPGYTFLDTSLMFGRVNRLNIHSMTFVLRLDQEILTPVALSEEATPPDTFEIQLTGSFAIDSQLSARASLDSFSIPPFAIADTGLILGLERCQLDLSTDSTPSTVDALGYDETFRGVYAEKAHLHWLPEVIFDGADLPGLHLTFEKAVVGYSQNGVGVGFDLRQEWPLRIENGNFTDDTEFKGFLFDPEWQVALSKIEGEVRQNIPRRFYAAGMLRVPPLQSILGAEFGVGGENITTISVYKADDETVEIPLPGDSSLTLTRFMASGTLAEDGFSVRGVIGGGLQLGGFDPITLEQATVDLSHSSQQDEFGVHIDGLTFGELGEVEEATFRFKTSLDASTGQRHTSILLETTLAWQDLSTRLNLSELPLFFPRPPDEAEITAYLYWADNNWKLRFSAALTDLDFLEDFIPLPSAYLPEIRSVEFAFEATHQESNNTFTGEASLALTARLPEELPEVPGLELMQISTGDEEGWVDFKLTAGFKPNDAGQSQPYMNGAFKNPVTIDLNFPGLPQNEPPLHISIEELDFDLKSGPEDGVAGGLKLTGDFNLRPINPADSALPVPPIMASHLQKLFQPLEMSDFGGQAEFALQFANDKTQMNLACKFSEARIDLDLFDMMAGVTRGLPTPEGLDDPANTIDLDIDVGFDLRQIGLQIGSIAQNEAAQSEFTFALDFGLTFAGVHGDMSFKLSEREVSFGLKELTIPLAIPRFPLHLDDMNALRDSQDRWDVNKWENEVYPGLMALELTKYDLTQPLLEEIADDPDLADLVLTEPALTQLIEKVGQVIEDVKQQIETFEAEIADVSDGSEPSSNYNELRRLREQVLPNLNQATFLLSAKKFLIQSIFAIYRTLPQNQAQFQTYFEFYQTTMDNTLGMIHLESGLSLKLSEVRFALPFANPADIRVEGGAQLQGFNPDSPLAPLNDWNLKLGLSAEFIYLSVEGGDSIPLPDYGRYTGGEIGLKHLRIGYGFTKNSLKIAVAGELKLPEQLVEDADTSKEIGAGIRLPLESRLAFKLDLIPIVLGQVDFLLPLFEFDIDLRREGAAGLLNSQTCEPSWDGLQLHAPDLLRVAFKHARFAPFFGPLPAPNYTLSYDIVLGDDHTGLSFVCDNYQVIMPVMGTIPIPFLADGTPYFDNQCVNVRLAGFGVNFNLQRPFPSMSPLAMFEILGLLADPAMPIDPKGSLAETIRAAILDAYITLPPAVVRMFPESGNILHQEVNYTVNLGAVIGVAQQMVSLIRHVIEAAAMTTTDVAALIEHIIDNPPDINPAAILRLLPPELRRFQLHGSLVGFDASAVFFLLSPEEAADEFDRRDESRSNDDLQLLFEDTFADADLTGWQAIHHDPSKPGDWSSDGSTLRQRNNTPSSLFIYTQETFANMVFSTVLRSEDDDGIGVVFGYRDAHNYYRFRMTSEQRSWILTRIIDDQATDLYSSQDCFEVGERYTVTVKTTRTLSLPQPTLPPPVIRPGVSRPRPVGRLRLVSITKIEIMANNQTWCAIEDIDSPLAAGHIGLESWWNSGAFYESVRVYGADTSWLKPGQAVDADVLNRFQPQLSNQTQPVYLPDAPGSNLLTGVELLTGFTAKDVTSVLPAQTDAAAIMIGARVRVFGTQIYRFLGFLDSDGHFSLISSADIEPLHLEIAGIPFELPLEIHGRLALRGRSFGADSWAVVEASAWGYWDAIPELARLEIATESEPARLEIRSDGRFALIGSGRLLLFGGQAVIEGAVDISHTHCFVEGAFHYQSGHKINKVPLVALGLTGAGRIGPGSSFELGGAGTLNILGQTISHVQGLISDKGVAVEAGFDIENWDWNGIQIKQFSMALRGMLDLSQSGPPKFLFEGDTYLRLFGAHTSANRLEITGRGGIQAEDGNLSTFVEGRLFWQGREWLQGRMRLHSATGLHLEGHMHFGLILSPDNIGGIDVANLFFRINLGGTVDISPTGTFQCSLHLDWDLGINLPGNENQTLPLASDAIHLSGTLAQSIDLINLEGFKLLPLQGFEISLPIPKIKGTGNPVLKVGTKNDKIAINVPQLGTLYMDEREFMIGLTGGTPPTLNPGTPPTFNPGTLPTIVPWNAGSLPTLNAGTLPTFNPGTFPTPTKISIPIPKYSLGERFDADSNTASIYRDYTVSWEEEKIPIDLTAFQSLPIRFGIDKQDYRFYVQIGQKKYALNGNLL